jgi:hypothetical protein
MDHSQIVATKDGMKHCCYIFNMVLTGVPTYKIYVLYSTGSLGIAARMKLVFGACK